MLTPPFVIDLDEQASGGYWATLTDESGNIVTGNTISAITLTLYTINADGTLTFINGRNKQSVLNINDVTLYTTLQTRADGLTYNLFWQIRQGDTTIVNEALTIERHIGLFEWSWPNNHFGKQEVWLAIKNLVDVP